MTTGYAVVDRVFPLRGARGALYKKQDNEDTHSRLINPLTPNDPYRGRTEPLTSKRCVLYIY